jgi:hypothetical protein
MRTAVVLDEVRAKYARFFHPVRMVSYLLRAARYSRCQAGSPTSSSGSSGPPSRFGGGPFFHLRVMGLTPSC